MKKWLFFGGGVLTGIVLTFAFAFIFSTSHSGNDDGTTWFEKPGDVIEVKAFKVFQVLGEDAALVNGQLTKNMTSIQVLSIFLPMKMVNTITMTK